MLTASEMFPQIDNEEFPFYRPKEHETKVSLVQPIFNSDIIYNYRIRKQYTEICKNRCGPLQEGADQRDHQSLLRISESLHLVKLADTTISLVRENLRVSQRLFDNDKVTIDAVYRSESELSKVEVQRAQAKICWRPPGPISISC